MSCEFDLEIHFLLTNQIYSFLNSCAIFVFECFLKDTEKCFSGSHQWWAVLWRHVVLVAIPFWQCGYQESSHYVHSFIVDAFGMPIFLVFHYRQLSSYLHERKHFFNRNRMFMKERIVSFTWMAKNNWNEDNRTVIKLNGIQNDWLNLRMTCRNTRHNSREVWLPEWCHNAENNWVYLYSRIVFSSPA